MNVYDFDNTIYNGDSTVEFYRFCRKRKPSLIWRYGMEQLFGFVYYGMGGVSKTTLKEYFFSFLRGLEDVDGLVAEFWAERMDNLAPWFPPLRQQGDLVISASPEFLLRPVCDALGLELIASRVDPKTGKFTGENCRGEEKVTRFREQYPEAVVENFYSDSLSDTPMAKIAVNAWFVSGGKLHPWEKTWRTKQ